MQKLPQEFLDRMKSQLGAEYPAFLASYDQPATRGLRVNTLKIAPADFLKISPFALRPSGVAADSFILIEDAQGVGRHPYHAAGLFYVQEPSAALPGALAGIEPGMRVLDLCAAPGGKSGAAAARLAGQGFLLANEVVPNRARVLLSTLERMGVVNAAVTSARPEAVAEAFPAYFDVVLVDAPCSGEGMFRKDGEAVAAWSPAHVRACAARQRLILDSAAKCVREGGVIVYSTCTFSAEEDEAVVEGFARDNPGFLIEAMIRLYPHTSAGEGHFAARLRRTGGEYEAQQPLRLKPCKDVQYRAVMEDIFSSLPDGEPYVLPDGRVTLLRELLPAGLARLRVLSSGVAAGELAQGRFAPSHALFLAVHGGVFSKVLSFSPQAQTLAAFMAGEELSAGENLKGYCAVAVEGYPLGFGKASAGALKNHLPKGLRAGGNVSARH
ncbi:MAG TPA: RsmF rRNA methyltransferase first C-terminal domain-containing protein [Clostridia bacterium]|nr:RsmF rRNA methyltransferase first C-terminal domain-containing protein [Clostridia bacterium]